MRIIIEAIESEISRLRANVRMAGDDADIVYIGEDIGKLEVARNILRDHEWPTHNTG